VTGEAASGLDVNSGTPTDVEATQKETDALGTQRVIDASQLQAYGYRTQGTNFGAQAGRAGYRRVRTGDHGGRSFGLWRSSGRREQRGAELYKLAAEGNVRIEPDDR
jgi:hypothetical protein